MNEQEALQAIAERMAYFKATYNGRPVAVDVDTVKDGKVTVKGDFGNEWTHGGFAPKSKMVVAISDLTNKMICLNNGEVVHAKG